jgi:sepiapterin reductase
LGELATQLNTNVTACYFLTSELVSKFKSHQIHASSLCIVNISSLAAIQPIASWGVYGVGKAAREMLHRTLADETKTRTDIQILNYAPGPMDTDMQKAIRDSPNLDPDVQEYFKKMKLENKLVPCDVSADKLTTLLNTKDSFVSGAHIDYYDV